jgi:polysaccharide pyruvyl transferase CsaB
VRLLFSGYFGFGNLGDELILSEMIKGLLNKDPAIEICVLSAKPMKTRNIHLVQSSNRWNLTDVIKSVSWCDGLVSGPGGLFQDRTGSLSLYYYLAIIFLARLLGKKIFLIGVGVDELKPFNKKIFSIMAGLADKIAVRDEESLRLLRDWGCKSKAEVTSDLAFFCKSADNKTSVAGKKPRISFILRNRSDNEQLIKSVKTVIDLLKKEVDINVVFVPFQVPCDIKINETAARTCGVNVLASDSFDMGAILKYISESDAVISQRFHGLVLAAVNKIPFAALYDDAKITRLLKTFGRENLISFLYSDPALVADRIKVLIKQKGLNRPDDENILRILNEKSMRNIDLICDVRNMFSDKGRSSL